VDESLRAITDAAAARGQLAVTAVELDRKSAQLEALNKLVSYLKLHSTLFSASAPTPALASVAPSPQHSQSATIDGLRESLSLRTAEVAFWRESHEQMATALVFAEEELHAQTAAKAKCEEQARAAAAAAALDLAAAQNRYSALQEQAGDLIAQTEELARIIEQKNQEVAIAGRTHSEYVQYTTRLMEQHELALADMQRQTIQYSSSQLPSSTGTGDVANESGDRPGAVEDTSAESVKKLRLQVQELEEQLSHQTRTTRTNLNPTYNPSSSAAMESLVSALDYIPPPLPPSDLLDEVGFLSANAGTMISLASSDPTSLVASVSASLDELGRCVTLHLTSLPPQRERISFIETVFLFHHHRFDSRCRVHDVAWTRVNDAELDVLEGRLDSMISKFRRVKFLRLQLQKQELEDTKKCRLCQVKLPNYFPQISCRPSHHEPCPQDNDVEVVLLPCGHHCLCRGCAANLVICPLCRASIENRVRTFGS
jgi:hypothetical protein